MEDLILNFSAYVFGFLFLFILFIFATAIIGLFSKKKISGFEPKISIVVPCYNEEKNIAKCLDAIFNSDYDLKKIEVVVVDDGSKDRTIEIVAGYQKNHKSLKLVKGNHSGKSESLNRGTLKSSHDFVITLDADTIVAKNAIKNLVKPMQHSRVGATNGSCLVRNKKGILGTFQNLEYNYNNLIRKSFSDVFNNGIWFFGAFACYKKKVLEEIGYFKKDTLTEDMDTALEIYSKGYKIINVYDAFGYTLVPKTLMQLIKQRTRWWLGVLQALGKNGKLFSLKSGPAIIFLFINQYWWTFFAFLSIPLIAYQYAYWLPYNIASSYDLFLYTFRWFSLLGCFHVIYMIPEWGISGYSIFGVLSGIFSTILILYAIFLFKDRLSFRSLIGIFFYFPYTILLNIIIILSLIKIIFLKRKFFIS